MVDRRASRPSRAPIRAAVDVGPLYGPRTGVGVACHGIIEALRRRDDVTTTPYLTSFRSRPGDDHRRLPFPGIVASHLWSRSPIPRADRWLGDVDVVHGTNYVAPPSRHPVVISVYDCWFLRHTELAAPLVRRAGLTLRRAVARGAWIHTSSVATATEAEQLLGTDRVRPILLGPPETEEGGHEDAPPTIAAGFADRPFVVAIGTEERRKGMPLLVEAFGRLSRRLAAGPHLVIAGAPGDDSAAIDAAVAALPAEVRATVHRLGRVDPPTKTWLLGRATLLAYPSVDEGFGFPVLEAQAAGTPVVATAVGSVPEIAGDGAELVRQRDAETFAAALHTVLDDEARRSELIAHGTRNLRRFSWEATADGLVDLYRCAVEAA